MLRSILGLVACIAPAVAQPSTWRPPTEPEVEVVEGVLETYPVTGTTPRQMREAMKANGPYFWDLRATAHAAANWAIDWNYREERLEHGCRVGSFEVTVVIKLVMPEWRDREDARAEVRADWDAYYADLLRHERGHHAIAVDAGNELARRVRALGTFPDCASVSMAIARERLQVKGKYQFRQRDYDDQERRRKRGAGF